VRQVLNLIVVHEIINNCSQIVHLLLNCLAVSPKADNLYGVVVHEFELMDATF
jgi:hypothetical protein